MNICKWYKLSLLLMHVVLLWSRLIHTINAYFSNALWDAGDVCVCVCFKTECIVSLEVVGPLFPWTAILKARYFNNVRVRVTGLHWGYRRIFGIAALWNTGAESNRTLPWSTLLCKPTAAYTFTSTQNGSSCKGRSGILRIVIRIATLLFKLLNAKSYSMLSCIHARSRGMSSS